MRIRVLFLAANPKDLDELGLEEEVETIRENIIASDFGDEIMNAVIDASEERGSLSSTKSQAELLRDALQVPDDAWQPIAGLRNDTP